MALVLFHSTFSFFETIVLLDVLMGIEVKRTTIQCTCIKTRVQSKLSCSEHFGFPGQVFW